MSSNSILTGKNAAIAVICRRYRVQKLYLFGSALRPDFRSDSDIDLLVEFAAGAPIGLLEYGKLQQELEALLQRKVDLVSKQGLKPFVRERVLDQAEPVYAG
jgi:uncharacterized protein